MRGTHLCKSKPQTLDKKHAVWFTIDSVSWCVRVGYTVYTVWTSNYKRDNFWEARTMLWTMGITGCRLMPKEFCLIYQNSALVVGLWPETSYKLPSLITHAQLIKIWRNSRNFLWCDDPLKITAFLNCQRNISKSIYSRTWSLIN